MNFNIDEFIKKHDVHPETTAFLKAAAASGERPCYEIGVETYRNMFHERNKFMAGTTEFEGSEQELCVPSEHIKDGIPVSVYKPVSCDNLAAPIILVYFHGGGHVVGSRKSHETVCKILARDSPCIVVNVEYRLAPEHKFPANHDDATCVLDWVAKNKAAVGGVAESKLGVCGDTAGGTLAAAVCHALHEHIQFAVLVYPGVDYKPYPSMEEFGDGPVISAEVMKWYSAQYISEDDMKSPTTSLIRHKEFSYLPKTLIIVAELDPLRDGCYAYHDALKKGAVDVKVKTIKGVPHGFWSWPAIFKQSFHEAHGAATDFIKSVQT